MNVRAVELWEANEFVALHHRHHFKAQGHRFSLGAFIGDKMVGVAIIGRPVARMTDHREVVEVTRLCTDGTPNACSKLYAAAARAAHALGYRRIQTFILDSESGTSLKASGWRLDGESSGGQWVHTDGKPRRTDQPIQPKRRYCKDLFSGDDHAKP
jgi:hypothetical protein